MRTLAPTAIFCFEAAWRVVKFGFGLLMKFLIPETHEPLYSYTPLAEKDIRLVRLTRRRLFGGVERSLIHVSLEKAPPYECVSYTWGDSTKTHSILIDGFQLPVSTSVYNILHQRASIWSSRLLWIDAICINQNDTEERARQVQNMRIIYKTANRVTVFLGSSPDAKYAIILLNKLAFWTKNCEPLVQWRRIIDSYMRHEEMRGQKPKDWAALMRLFNNPWFERAWVVQEVTMASEIYVLYGGKYINWEVLMYVILALGKGECAVLKSAVTRVDKDHMIPFLPGLSNGILLQEFRTLFLSSEPMKLHLILRACLPFHATEPRDKIFAIQGITEAVLHPLLPINYNKKVSEVLLSTARYFLQTPESLHVLQLAGIGWKRKNEDIPSWVVDWTMARPPHFLSFSNLGNSESAYKAAVQDARQVRQGRSEKSIVLEGIHWDDIDELGDSRDIDIHDNSPVDVRDSKRMWLSWFRRAEDLSHRKAPDPYHTGQPLSEAFWRTMIGDNGEGRPANPDYYLNFLDFRENVLRTNSSEGEVLTKSEEDFLRERKKGQRPFDSSFVGIWAFARAAGCACNDRRFAVTRKGYLAIVPPLTKLGDIVCLVMGAEVPFIMRKLPLHQSNEDYRDQQCYNLIGECYVHGIMDGEVLKDGPREEILERIDEFIVT
jgi:hypothetical protein